MRFHLARAADYENFFDTNPGSSSASSSCMPPSCPPQKVQQAEAPMGNSRDEPAVSKGKDLLEDRVRTLNCFPKSAPSKSKRKQFEEEKGFKKPRGGKMRGYYAWQFGRDL